MRRRATLKDVAQAAGVHLGTVSRVLHPTTRELVNAEAAARIDEIIAELNYRLGHERIAHLAGPPPVSNSGERRRGFIAAMKRPGQSTDAPIAGASRCAIEDGERAAALLLAALDTASSGGDPPQGKVRLSSS